MICLFKVHQHRLRQGRGHLSVGVRYPDPKDASEHWSSLSQAPSSFCQIALWSKSRSTLGRVWKRVTLSPRPRWTRAGVQNPAVFRRRGSSADRIHSSGRGLRSPLWLLSLPGGGLTHSPQSSEDEALVPRGEAHPRRRVCGLHTRGPRGRRHLPTSQNLGVWWTPTSSTGAGPPAPGPLWAPGP